MSAAHATKFGPQRALSSMASSSQRLAAPATPSRTLNDRFREAVARLKAATGQSSAEIAAALDVELTRFNHWVKISGARPVNLSAVQQIEALVQGVRAEVSPEEIVQAARELATAEAHWERIKRHLMEGAA